MPEVTITLDSWWLVAWCAAGVVVYLPLCVLAWKDGSASSRGSFMAYWTYRPFGWSRRKRAWRMLRSFIVMVVAWPLAWWEAL